MSEQTNIPQDPETETQDTQESKAPTKAEIINFYKEQISVKKYQVELQELNTRIAVGRAEEIKALAFIANMSNPKEEPELVDHVVSQEDMDNNPDLAEHGINVGDTVKIPKQPERKLKKA